MSHRTQFAGLAAPDVGESPTQVQNGDFVYRNPDLIDQFLRIGAVTHHHDGHAALVSPSKPLTLALGSGGQLDADTTYWMTYTTVDGVGGETTAATPASAHTSSTLPDPTIAPSAGVSYASGIMPAGNYAYALTYTDGQGGETLLGPITWVYVAPGFASAQVILTNLDLELTSHGGQAVDYRLWRSYEGNDWHLVTELAGATFVDDGFDPPDNPARPPETNTTKGVNQRIFFTFPSVAQEPSLGAATAVRVYIGLDSTFASPALASAFGSGGSVAGHTYEIDVFAPATGQPPSVSLSLPGASQINPDTDLVDWHWKRPVGLISQLPASGNASGDARMVMTPLSIFAYTGVQWQPVAAASGIGGAATTTTASAGVFVAGLNGTSPSPFGREGYIEFGGSGGTSVSVTNLGGGSARVVISGSGGTGAGGFGLASAAAPSSGSAAAVQGATNLAVIGGGYSSMQGLITALLQLDPLPPFYKDGFDTDSFAAGYLGSTVGTPQVTGSQLSPNSGAGEARVFVNLATFGKKPMRDGVIQVKFIPGGGSTDFWLSFGNHNTVFQISGGTAALKNFTGTTTTPASQGVTLTSGTPYWIRFELQRGTAFGEIWTKDPATRQPGDQPTLALSIPLGGASGRAFTYGNPGIRFNSGTAADRVDDLRVWSFPEAIE